MRKIMSLPKTTGSIVNNTTVTRQVSGKGGQEQLSDSYFDFDCPIL